MAIIADPQHPREDEILWDVAGKHLDEAEFMFETWEAALDSPLYTLAELAAGPEQRLLAHVDAMIVNGPVLAERLLLPTIVDPDASYERVAAAALAYGDEDRILEILSEADEGERRRGLLRALELSTDPSLDAKLLRALDSPHHLATAAALELLARRRARLDGGLIRFLHSTDPNIARPAARLARQCTDPRALYELAAHAQASDFTVRHAALETALCRQVGGAWESAVYWAFVPGPSPFRRDALTWVAILGDATAHRRLLALVDAPEHRADALWALGFSGRVDAVDRCVELLDDEEVGPLAAEVICAIAGLSTEDDSFWRSPPAADDEAHTLPELADDDLDGDLVPDAEASLPAPEPRAISLWWSERRASFDPAVRYLNGQAFTGQALLNAFATGPMSRRHALAIELELRTRARTAIDARALSRIQQSQLAALAAIEMPNFQRAEHEHHS